MHVAKNKLLPQLYTHTHTHTKKISHLRTLIDTDGEADASVFRALLILSVMSNEIGEPDAPSVVQT